jgi:hypothetical protein
MPGRWDFEVSPEPTAEEAAATIAAIERFLQDTALPAAHVGEPGYSGWLRAALHEGIGSTDPDQIW